MLHAADEAVAGQQFRYSQSAQVRMYMMSLKYARVGALGLNSRFSTLAANGRSCLLSVAWMNLRFQTVFDAC